MVEIPIANAFSDSADHVIKVLPTGDGTPSRLRFRLGLRLMKEIKQGSSPSSSFRSSIRTDVVIVVGRDGPLEMVG